MAAWGCRWWGLPSWVRAGPGSQALSLCPSQEQGDRGSRTAPVPGLRHLLRPGQRPMGLGQLHTWAGELQLWLRPNRRGLCGNSSHRPGVKLLVTLPVGQGLPSPTHMIAELTASPR